MTAPAPERLAELLAAVEMAEGPSRELDDAIAFQIDGYEHYESFNPDSGESTPGLARWRHESGAIWTGSRRDAVRHYTSSVDAALALVERVLPGWTWRIGNTADGLDCFCRLGASITEHYATTAPLAILAALLRALLAKETSDVA